ncbi:MAG: TIGR04283 family arsenosugar biosynthesis glycosyltransferase [Pseudomonadota bacterium]
MHLRDLTIAVPVYRDDPALNRLLAQLSDWPVEIIITHAGAAPQLEVGPTTRMVQLVPAPAPNRGAQLALAAQRASREWLWFLHADSGLPAAVERQLNALSVPGWARFDVELDDRRPMLRLVGAFMNLRSRLTGICTGDQGIIVHRSLLERIGGVPEQPLMEDIELSKRLRRIEAPQILRGPLITSARRWQQQGIWRTVLSMWGLRLRYFFGASPQALADRYYGRAR